MAFSVKTHRWKLAATIALVAAVAIIAIVLPTPKARIIFLIPLAVFGVVTAVMTFVLRFQASE